MHQPVSKTGLRGRYRPLAQDFILAFLSIVFAVCSFAFPRTGWPDYSGFPRGDLMGFVFLGTAALSLLAPFVGDEAPAILRFLRIFYPQALMPLFFQESILLSVETFRGRTFDAQIAAIDQAIFGFQPARWFHHALDSFPAINELMFASYFLYYIIFSVTPWLLYLAGRDEDSRRLMFVLSAMMAIIFIWYLFFRVEGPKYWFEDLRRKAYSEFQGGFFVHFFQGVFRSTPLYGAAFPSTHVAFTLLMLIAAVRLDRRLAWVYGPGLVLVGCATVYLYAHYFTDVLGGLAVTALLEPLLWRAYPRIRAALERRSPERGA
ncbi:MAG TPA: phosphatase PAP2 family protein [Rectinemataceae bacterium]|nr:phosphatase PAP2 family protein [Rectinemataceae bacterium]